MSLSEPDIRARLAKGDLRIDPPPDDALLSALGIDLRLGTGFIRTSKLSSAPEQIELGEKLTILPQEAILVSTLEYVYLPQDLAGLVFPRASLIRVGLFVATSRIDPGFQGKLTFSLHNGGSVPVVLRSGQSIAQLCFETLSDPVTSRPVRSSLPLDAEIRSAKSALQKIEPRRAPSAAAAQSLRELWTRVLTTKGTAKGKVLEEFMDKLFTGLDGLSVLKRNARLRAEELDLVIMNSLDKGFWRLAGSPIIVECKNWSAKVGAREISVLIEKLQALSPDAKTGILVALSDITGRPNSNAVLKIREGRQRGRYILLLNRTDLEKIVNGEPLAQVIERKYVETLLIG
jgi:dCTP deaminase